MSNHKTIFWHDYETWGADPRKDRPCQFAGIRTDEDLNPVDDPVVLWCKPAPDFLPHPEACLVTGISPEEAATKGLTEAEFSARIMAEFGQPNTCVSGYNSIRFDDEVTRHLFYRCFYDPYGREWKNGNSRWDIIDLVRMTHALRPEGINWPQKEDGSPSFKLENLTAANGIEHTGAHDALVDVRATIDFARLIKQAQPKLYDWLYQLRDKKKAQNLLDLRKKDMLLHVSGMFPASQGCLAVVMPLAAHPGNANGIIVADLSQDPESWLDLDSAEIRHRLFTRGEELAGEGLERVALKTVHINKCPALAPMATLDNATRARYGINLDRCARFREILLNDATVHNKLREVFAEPEHEQQTDPDHMLYGGGFFGDQDRELMDEIIVTPGDALGGLSLPFRDKRLPEMLFRYRGRNFPDSLDAQEKRRWHAWCAQQLATNPNGVGLSAPEYFRTLENLRQAHPQEQPLFDALYRYGENLCSEMGVAW